MQARRSQLFQSISVSPVHGRCFSGVVRTLTFLVASVFSTDCLAAEPVRVAAILPLSGNGAEHGTWIRHGLEIAVAELNQAGEQHIHIVFEDSKGEAATAVSAYRKVKSDGPLAVVFTWGSGIAMALAPILNRDQVIQMGVATSTVAYSTPNDFNFRNYPTAAQEADFLSRLAQERFSADEIAIVHTENDYGVSTAAEFAKAFTTPRGASPAGKVLITTELSPGNTDCRSQALNVRKANPKLVFLAAYPVEGSAFLKQARQVGIEVPIVASVALFGSFEFLASIGAPADGLVLGATVPKSVLESAFAQAFTKQSGEPFGPQHFYAVGAYDAMTAITATLKRCQTGEVHAVCMQRELPNLPAFAGVGGTIDFDERGDVAPTFTAYTVRNGSYRPLE